MTLNTLEWLLEQYGTPKVVELCSLPYHYLCCLLHSVLATVWLSLCNITVGMHQRLRTRLLSGGINVYTQDTIMGKIFQQWVLMTPFFLMVVRVFVFGPEIVFRWFLSNHSMDWLILCAAQCVFGAKIKLKD